MSKQFFKKVLFFFGLVCSLSCHGFVETSSELIEENRTLEQQNFLEEFQKEFGSSYVKVMNEMVSIYPQANFINCFPEFFLSLLAGVSFYGAYNIDYEPVKSCDFCTKVIDVPTKIKWILAGIALNITVAGLLYQKFGFDGPVLEFGQIGLKYKNRHVFTWHELNNVKVEEIFAYFPINILNCYSDKDKSLFSLQRKFIALPGDLNFNSLQKLIEYFCTKYHRSKKV